MLEASTQPAHEGAFRIDEERPKPGVVVFALQGDADLHAAPELRDLLSIAIDRGARTIVVDFAETSFVDSTALGVLLGAVKRLRDKGGEMQLVVARPEIRRMFEITLLDQVFPLQETRARALAAVSDGAGLARVVE
jgi:anti-sigma B factor antagonist